MSKPLTICRREGNRIQPTCIMGELSIVHEAGNGVVVVKEIARSTKLGALGRKHIATRYRLCRIRPYRHEDSSQIMFNSDHLADYPMVLEQYEEYQPGNDWRKALEAIKAEADKLSQETKESA